MAIFSSRKKKTGGNEAEVENTNEMSPVDNNHDFQTGVLGENEQRQIDDSDAINGEIDEMPSANASGREGGSKKKLQLALMGLVGLLVVLVGIGVAVARYEDSREEKRVAEAEQTAQDQKKMATGGRLDISEDKARIEMMQFDDLPPPSGLESDDDLGLGMQADNSSAYQPITPVDNTPAYVAPTPAPSYEAPVQAFNPPPVDNTPPSTGGGFFGGGNMTASTVSEPMDSQPFEMQVPLPKGADSDVLVDVNAVKAVQASAGNNNQKPRGNGVGGNLDRTVLQDSSASRRKSNTLTLLRGTTIPCVLQTKIDSTYKGFTVCQTSKDVYSADGKTLLIDRGSKVFGEQNVEIKQGQARVAVLWTRVETPKGVSVDIDSPATGSLGEMGVGANVKNHFWKRFGGAIMLSIIQDAISTTASRYEDKNENSGDNNTTITNTQRTTESMAEKALENTINIPPTATVNQGTLVNIMVVRDIDFTNVYKLRRR